jgi:signal transduction histidine kinase
MFPGCNQPGTCDHGDHGYAIKFSPDGGTVFVEVNYNSSWVWVRVEDHGVGIPSEAIPRIFDRYYRLDEVGGHLFRGVGLGLSIARKVIEEHGGRISVDSTLRKGSVFTVYLPLS